MPRGATAMSALESISRGRLCPSQQEGLHQVLPGSFSLCNQLSVCEREESTTQGGERCTEKRVRELRGSDTALIPATLSENARRCLAAGCRHTVRRRALACRSCRYHTFSGMKSLRMKIVWDLLVVAAFFHSSISVNIPSAKCYNHHKAMLICFSTAGTVSSSECAAERPESSRAWQSHEPPPCLVGGFMRRSQRCRQQSGS